MVVFDQNPESNRMTNSPVAPARRSRATSSQMNRLVPRWVLADPLRIRTWRSSPVPGPGGEEGAVAELLGSRSRHRAWPCRTPHRWWSRGRRPVGLILVLSPIPTPDAAPRPEPDRVGGHGRRRRTAGTYPTWRAPSPDEAAPTG